MRKLPKTIEILGDTVKICIRKSVVNKAIPNSDAAGATYSLREKCITLKASNLFELHEMLLHEIVEYILAKEYLIRFSDDGCRYMTFNHEPYSKYGDAFSVLIITIHDTIKRNKLQWLFT